MNAGLSSHNMLIHVQTDFQDFQHELVPNMWLDRDQSYLSMKMELAISQGMQKTGSEMLRNYDWKLVGNHNNELSLSSTKEDEPDNMDMLLMFKIFRAMGLSSFQK